MNDASGEEARIAELVAGCEREQLHLSGAIQPHGALVFIAASDARITHASANTAAFLGLEPSSLLGADARAALPFLSAGHLTEGAPGKVLVEAQPVAINDRNVLLTVTAHDQGWLVECQAPPSVEPPPGASMRLSQRLMRPPSSDDELPAYYARAAAAVREASGFDRVMIYRFHEDWSGEVVAEDGEQSFGSYLGLRFPASDIPRIARDLYQVTGSRLIPDVEAAPVGLLTASPATPPLDLTHTDLRSVSPVHIRYLQNMQVGASFSLAVRLKDSLWGLIACHHRTAWGISPRQRRVCLEIANAFSLGLMGHSAMVRMRFVDQAERRVGQLLAGLGETFPLLEHLAGKADEIMGLARGAGLFLALDRDHFQHGDVPGPAALRRVDDWFMDQASDLVVTEQLESQLPEATKWRDTASGLLAFRVRVARAFDREWLRVYWFRPEAPRTVHWAGRPEKSMVRIGGQDMLNPRKSFEHWSEVTRGQSASWSQQDQIMAMRLRSQLLQFARG